MITGVSKVGPNASQIGTTIRLPYNATAAQIDSALEAVSQASITVIDGTTPGTFEIAFNEIGDQPTIVGTGYFRETQNVDVYAIGNFELKFNSLVTNRIAPPPDPLLRPAEAELVRQAIDSELEQLASIRALSGPVGDKVEVHIGPNSSFSVLFHADGDVAPLGGTQFESLSANNLINGINRNGTATTRESQEISYSSKGAFDPVYFATANLVGAISDTNEIDSNVFHFLHNNVLTAGDSFKEGDTPIDGLIMAKVFRQEAPTNFTPEAKFTLFGFFDNDNFI